MFIDSLKKLWDRKRPPTTVTAAADTSGTPHDPSSDLETSDSLLTSALLQHRVPSHREGVTHVLPGGLRLTPLVHEVPIATPGNFIVAFELRAESARTNGKIISSGVAGLGESRQQALNQAFVKTLMSSFHVVLDALSDHKCTECQSEIEHWEGKDAAWTVYEGSLLTQYSGESLLTETYVTHAWPALRQLFERTQSEGIHWVSVFVAGFQGEVQEIDVLLDNEPWPDANTLLAQQPWHVGEEFESARHFVLAMPAPG